MYNSLNHYILIVKRWAWLIILGIIICGGISYMVSKLAHPQYQATSTMVLNACTAQSSAYDCTTAGLEALPTYAQLVTSPEVLNPIVVHHPGLTLKQLTAMVRVKPQSNTLLMDVDVTNNDPHLAAQLANEVSQSFEQFAATQLQGTVQVIPAQVPTDPAGLKPLYAGAIGALVGLGLALAMIVIFEWVDDRMTKPEELRDLLGKEASVTFPQLKGKEYASKVGESMVLTEGCAILSANLNAAQTSKSFKLMMVTSALVSEGKSIVAANLASFMASSGKRVLLVDANLRNPSLDGIFELEARESFSNALASSRTRTSSIPEGQLTEVANLRVLPAGTAFSNPAELLQSPRAASLFEQFQNASNFDCIIFDTPPLLPFADTQILASYMQAAILVVDASKTPRKALARTGQMLKRTRIAWLGVVLNKSPWPDYSAEGRYYQKAREQAQEEIAMTESDLPETPLPSVTDEDGQEVTITARRLNSNEHL